MIAARSRTVFGAQARYNLTSSVFIKGYRLYWGRAVNDLAEEYRQKQGWSLWLICQYAAKEKPKYTTVDRDNSLINAPNRH